MKISKSLFLAFAGLGLFACSNEDVTEGGVQFEGNGAVTIKLMNPGTASRSVTDPTGGDNLTEVPVTGDITVCLYEKSDLTKPSQTMVFKDSEINKETEMTFWNVTEPGKITVSVNGGVADYENVAITDLQSAPGKIPAYGETVKFTLTEDMKSPNLANDHEADGGNKLEQGANDGDESKLYQIYTAKVKMAIPVARLEVSGITHKTHADTPDDVCAYKTLTIKGVYMDNLFVKGGKYAEDYTSSVDVDGFYNSNFGFGSELQNYCWDADKNLGTGITAILKDAITKDDNVGDNFLEKGAKWPKSIGEDGLQAQTFAYNFYPAPGGNSMPIFKIYFDTSVSSDPQKPLPAPRYAMITKYKVGNSELSSFEPGVIYRIVKAELSDKNIIGDEGGNTLYGVEVTVKEATWSIFDIDAEWAE